MTFATDRLDHLLLVDALTPDQISGLFAWYDMSKLGLANNDAITAVSDLSGSGFDLTTPASDPVFHTDVSNGLGAAWFTSDADRRLDSSTFTGVGTPGMVIGVASCATASAGWVLFDGQGSSNRWNCGASGSGTTNFSLFAGGAGPAISTGTFSLSVFVALFNSSNSMLWREVDNTWATDGNAGTNSLTGIRIARHQTTTTRRFNGYIGELAYYNRRLRPDEFTPLVASLQAKWGI